MVLTPWQITAQISGRDSVMGLSPADLLCRCPRGAGTVRGCQMCADPEEDSGASKCWSDNMQEGAGADSGDGEGDKGDDGDNIEGESDRGDGDSTDKGDEGEAHSVTTKEVTAVAAAHSYRAQPASQLLF